MVKKVSTILFYLVAAWCIVVGFVNQTFTSADDLPWVAQALGDSDLTAFNPILAIWAHWIGMFLITAGAALILLTPVVHNSTRNVIASGILAVGTIGSQCYSVLSLGAFGPVVFALLTALACAIAAPVLGLIVVRNSQDGV